MLWMWFARVDITTQALGYVIPESNFTSIDTMVDGQVIEVKVKQGDLGSESGSIGKKEKVDASIFNKANEKDY